MINVSISTTCFSLHLKVLKDLQHSLSVHMHHEKCQTAIQYTVNVMLYKRCCMFINNSLQ